MPSAARELCDRSESNPDTAALVVTGQPEFVAPVSTLREKNWCPAPATSAFKKSEREARSTTGVAVMPSGLMLPHGRPDVTAVPRFRCHTIAPVVALRA